MIEFLKQGMEYGLIGAGAITTCGVLVLIVTFVLAVIIDAISSIGKHKEDK